MGSQVYASFLEGEFLANIFPVYFDGAIGYPQELGYLFGSFPLFYKIGDLQLLRGEF